jgi:hypothetical protein
LSVLLDREIDFDFDSLVRGEAKLCVRERHASLPRVSPVEFVSACAGVFRAIVVAMHIGFKSFDTILGGAVSFCIDVCMGFKD